MVLMVKLSLILSYENMFKISHCVRKKYSNCSGIMKTIHTQTMYRRILLANQPLYATIAKLVQFMNYFMANIINLLRKMLRMHN